ncbi:MAG: hypothetical protein J0I06_09290 [Planctomycetes bacterium]|nr:hypothetical protein [Planctomycetota bacterium]
MANGRRLPDDNPSSPTPTTVNQLILAFVPWAVGHYAKGDNGKTEVGSVKGA